MASYEWDEDKRIMIPSNNGICSDITDNELMNILKATSQYSDWPDSLKILHKKYSNFGYGGKFNRNSKKAQMVSFLVAHPKIALNEFQAAIPSRKEGVKTPFFDICIGRLHVISWNT